MLRFRRMSSIRLLGISINIGIILFASNAFSLIDIRQAHREAISIFTETKDVSKALAVLEQAGVGKIVKTKPRGLAEGVYASILNDYGFFLSETGDRWTEAIPILEKVLTIDPDRTVAHLNLADTYRKALQKTEEEGKHMHLRSLMVAEYVQYARLRLQHTTPTALPTRVVDILEEGQEGKYDDLTGRMTFVLDSVTSRFRVASLNDNRIAVGWGAINSVHHRFESRVVIYSLSQRTLGKPVTVCKECIFLDLMAAQDGLWVITRGQFPWGTNELSARHYSSVLKEIGVVNIGVASKIFAYPGYAFGVLRSSAQLILQLFPTDQEQAPSTRVLGVGPNTTDYSNPVVLDGGKMLFAWVKDEGGRKQIYGACIEAGSESLGEDFLIGGLGHRESSPTIVSNGTSHLVTWLDPDGKYDTSAIFGRVYDSTCRPSGPAARLIDTVICCSKSYEVLGFGSGRFLVVFEEESSSDGSSDVNAVILGKSGVTARFHVAGGAGNQMTPTAAVLPNADFVAFWLDMQGEDFLTQMIHARSFGGL